MVSEAKLLIFEIDTAVSNASESWRSELLRRVTDLYIAFHESLNERQIAIFEDVFARLIRNAEIPALIELSTRLMPLDDAPVKLVGQLARHDDMAISSPLLENSNALTEIALIEIVTTMRQNHLMAIAGRRRVSEVLTDSLIERGNTEVLQKVLANRAAVVSELGFVKMIGLAKTDKALAAAIATRTDMPPELEPFLKLTLA
jgi:uncharacterized protein (DUF2336 family)